MKRVQTDPIIGEIRTIRDLHAARCGYDIGRIFRDIRAWQEASGAEYVSRPARRVEGNQPLSLDGKEEGTFGHYVVGVFDVLGQSGKLRRQAGLGLSEEDAGERQRIIANLKDTAGVVVGTRLMFRTFFEGATQPTFLADSLPEPQRTEMLSATESKILLWGVSDAFFVAVPLARTRHAAAPVGDVFRSFLAAGCVWLFGLSTDHPVRGGIEIGTGFDLGPTEVYGQALEAAHQLESRVAGFPRIVVGPECVKFLEGVRRRDNDSEVAWRLAARNASGCLSMLREDTDGHTIVDGLGPAMRDMNRAIPGFRDQVSKAYGNVRTHCRAFRDAGDSKLAGRYEALRKYFEECAPTWDVTA